MWVGGLLMRCRWIVVVVLAQFAPTGKMSIASSGAFAFTETRKQASLADVFGYDSLLHICFLCRPALCPHDLVPAWSQHVCSVFLCSRDDPSTNPPSLRVACV